MDPDRVAHLTRRPGSCADMPFLLRVHREAMRPHVERVWGEWVDEDARREFEAKTDPGTHDILLWRGSPIGCCWVRRHRDALELVRLYLLPGYQGRGIGTHVVLGLLGEARVKGLPVRLRVLRGNPARGLYERLGFRVTRETETHVEMRAGPPGASPGPDPRPDPSHDFEP